MPTGNVSAVNHPQAWENLYLQQATAPQHSYTKTIALIVSHKPCPAMKIIFCFLAVLLINGNSFAQNDYIGTATMPPHPRLLMFTSDEATIKNTINADKTWSGLQEAILTESDNIIALPPVERIQIGRRLLDKSREALRRLFFLSWSYRMTQQEKYFQRAEKEMLAIAAFSDWNPPHFLDVAEMTMAMSIGYDWLYNKLSPQSKSTIRDAILKKGIEPSLDSKNNSWLRAETNWNQVCNAGMTYGALAIYEDQPVVARQVINRAIESVVTPMKEYAPDGAYPEGYGYWGYGTGFNVMFMSAIEKVFGKDFGLNQQPGFLSTAYYLENMTGPSGKPFNYSDAGNGGGLQPAMFWFAARQKNPSLLWVEKSRLMDANPRSYVDNRLLPAILLWSGGVSMNTITQPKSLTWTGKGKMPVALMRTSWNDPAAIFVGMKGGSAGVNHAHMDVGSFVMEADGVRWAMDFGMQDYESLESKGIAVFGRTQDAQRWSIFRYNNFTHNTITVNNQLQQVAGYAPIVSSTSGEKFMSAVTDLSEVYKGSLANIKRGVAIVDKKYVLVQDEIETGASQSTVRWTMLTPADVKIVGNNTIELTKDGKKVLLNVQRPANVSLKTWTTVPPNTYDAPNPGTTLVGFEVVLPANTKSTFVVNLIPAKVGEVKQKIKSLSEWPNK
jgi:hypothetical protein